MSREEAKTPRRNHERSISKTLTLAIYLFIYWLIDWSSTLMKLPCKAYVCREISIYLHLSRGNSLRKKIYYLFYIIMCRIIPVLILIECTDKIMSFHILSLSHCQWLLNCKEVVIIYILGCYWVCILVLRAHVQLFVCFALYIYIYICIAEMYVLLCQISCLE